MYKVFLVDDEIVIREGIRNSFPWEASGFALCGEAPDGEMALPMLQELKPDILVTDIRMPFMDGLALSRKVSQTMPWIHIVILSGYDDFAYAREAITLGVKEYMLKPVSAQKLEEVLSRIAGKIQGERAQQADMDALRRQLATSTRYARAQLLRQLLEGGEPASLLPQAESLHMRLAAAQYLVLLLAHRPETEQLALQGILQRLAEGAEGAACQTLVDGSAALLVMGESRSDLEERAYALAQALAHEAARSGAPVPAVAIGAPVAQLAHLPRALASAQGVLRAMQGRPHGILGATDIDAALSPELTDGEILPLYEKLRYAAQQDTARLVEEYLASLGGMAAQSLLVTHYMLVDILLACSRIIRAHGGDPAQHLPAQLRQEADLLRLAQHPQDALEAGKRMVALSLAFRDAHALSRYSDILHKARAFIEENYRRPEMTLHDVAKHVALSNNHFCTVFSQEMGQTFIEYLTRLRMEKAKALLLSSPLRSSDVALEVGYNDPHYFSYLFKRHTGASPRDFRKEERERAQ